MIVEQTGTITAFMLLARVKTLAIKIAKIATLEALK